MSMSLCSPTSHPLTLTLTLTHTLILSHTQTHIPFLSLCILHITVIHYNDVIMSAMASQMTSLTIVYSTVYWGAHQRKHQSSASQAFVRGIHRWPVRSPHKWPVTRRMFPFLDVIMLYCDRNVLNIFAVIWREWSFFHPFVTIPFMKKSEIKIKILYHTLVFRLHQYWILW